MAHGGSLSGRSKAAGADDRGGGRAKDRCSGRGAGRTAMPTDQVTACKANRELGAPGRWNR